MPFGNPFYLESFEWVSKFAAYSRDTLGSELSMISSESCWSDKRGGGVGTEILERAFGTGFSRSAIGGRIDRLAGSEILKYDLGLLERKENKN